MNQYIFIDLKSLTEVGPILYQVSANTVNSAIQTYSKVNNFPLKEMMEAAENNTLYLYWRVYGSTQGLLTQLDLVDYLQSLDIEIFLEDPYKYITHLLENARILDEKPKIQDPYLLDYNLSSSYFNYLLDYNLSSSYFNYLLRYLIYRVPNNHLVIRYHPSTNTLNMPEFSTEPPEENPSNINRVYTIDYVPYLTIHILVYKD